MSGSTLDLVLVRHAEHDRVGSVLCGRMAGVRLSETGRAQSKAVATSLCGRRVDAVYTSPLERTAETAQAIAEAIGVAYDLNDAFVEIDVGEWTGRRFDELGPDPLWQAWNNRRASAATPGGESMADVQGRTRREIERLRRQHSAGRVVVVSHCDVIKAVICDVLGLSLDRFLSFDIDPASLSEVTVWEGGSKLLRLNGAVAS